MDSYALVAFATPVAALLLGWAAVTLHRRSLHGRLAPEERAERLTLREQELEASLDALSARADDVRQRSARLRAELERIEHGESRRRTGPDQGTVLAR